MHRKHHGKGVSVTLWEDLLGLAGKAMSEKCQT
jgi:hypothetical protein